MEAAAPFSPAYCLVIDAPWFVVNAVACLGTVILLMIVGCAAVIPVRDK